MRTSPQLDPRWWLTSNWDGCPLREALARRDMGVVFRFLRSQGWSRTAVAAATGLSESRVREVAQGKQRITSYEVLERVAEGLTIDRGLMGLAYATPALAPPLPPERATATTGISRPVRLRRRSAVGGDLTHLSAYPAALAQAPESRGLGSPSGCQ